MEMAERFLEATKGCYEPTTKRVLITSLLNQAILTPRSIGEVISCKLCVRSSISNSRWETLKTPDPLCGTRVDGTGCESVRLGQSFPQRLPFSWFNILSCGQWNALRSWMLSSSAVTAVLIWGVSWQVRVQRCFTCTSENDRELMVTFTEPTCLLLSVYEN